MLVCAHRSYESGK